MAYPSNRPDKQPIVKTPVTDGQYASFVDRVIACREAEDRAKEDTKALYAEIAAAGEDKTYIGLVVRGLRLSNKDRVKAEIRDAAVEEGRARYRRGKASHVRAREGSSESTTPNTSNSGADSAKSTPSVTTPDITGFSRDLPDHDPLTGVIEDNEPADREHITGSVGKEFPNNEPAPPATPEVAADAGNDPASEAEEPGPDSSAPNPIEAPRGVEGEAEGASASPANTNNIVRISSKPLRPYCQHQDDFTKCGGYGHTHCANCAKLKRAAEINVVAGGTEIPHQGDVA